MSLVLLLQFHVGLESFSLRLPSLSPVLGIPRGQWLYLIPCFPKNKTRFHTTSHVLVPSTELDIQEELKALGKSKVYVIHLPEFQSRPKHLLTPGKVLSFSAVQVSHL